MTRVFLAAGVAALAISAPASAQRGERDRNDRSEVKRDRAERQTQRAQRVERPQRVERQAQRVERQAQRVERPQRVERQAQRVERQAQRVERPQRVERQAQRVERQAQRVERPQRVETRQQQRIERVADRTLRIEQRQVERRADLRADRPAVRMTERQQVRANRLDRINDGMQLRAEQRVERAQQRVMDRSPYFGRRVAAFRDASTTFPMAARGRGRALIDGCPPGLWMKGNDCMPPGQAAKLLGAPLATASSFMTLSELPNSVRYLYPDTPNYYYRYGDGYLYQVDRSDNLIAALIPLLAGGFIPGQYLPQSYMNSYVPNYYGLNSFYPSSYGQSYGYGYGYDNLCNRYANGVVYQVDCVTGMIQGVVPLYASGYGVGQMLPSAYSYYNVPYQYRDMYYDTNDYGYWYAPGAIYQYDTSSSLITSVAALLSPGFSVGQPLPMGYDVYNVPYGYRTTYYDSPNAWYRYNNGYIYQVDPATQLVTAIVASILT